MKLLSAQYIDDLFVTILGKESNEKSILFVHGGPGLNSQPVISYILKNEIFNSLNANIIFYDQRGCGKSKLGTGSNNYNRQILDLGSIINEVTSRFNLKAIIGHSYGAKLLSDYNQNNPLDLALIYMATAKNIDTPRKNNIKLDLDFLSRTDQGAYKEIQSSIGSLSLWETTELLAPTFHKNADRPLRYWSNHDVMKVYQDNSKELGFPMNNSVFVDLREELYNSQNKEISIDTGYHFIGGNDYVMGGSDFKASDKTVLFKESAHYPHLEEPIKFCKEINEII